MLEGRDECLLNGLLGEIEVAELADEGRECAPGLFAEDAIDDGMGISCGGRRLLGVLAQMGSSQTGRTSIAPSRAPGIFAAYWIASSRSFTSRR